MNEELAFVIICVCILIACLAFGGEPDLMDAIIERVRAK